MQQTNVEVIDVSSFTKKDSCTPIDCYFVVKSQDQLERRRRLIAKKKGGKFGRISARPVATGLVARCKVEGDTVSILWSKEFREPRHLYPYPSEQGKQRYLLTEMHQISLIDENGEVERTYTNPYFAFLHTIVVNKEKNRMLTVSSGYDCIFELDLESGDVAWQWSAWDHGFNPDGEGVYLALSKEKAAEYEKQGLTSMYIDAAEYGEQGLVTARRTAHPNAAAYNIYNDEKTVLLSMAHNGGIYEIDLATNEKTLKVNLDQMPHGLVPYNSGWLITNTTKAEFKLFDANLVEYKRIVLASLPGKPEEVGDSEWIQQVVAVGPNQFLCLDANRGLIVVDIEKKEYSLHAPDENWCIQDALILGQ